MKVLVACEFSGIVREAFSKQGHDVISCDLLPTEIPCFGNNQHYQGDIFELLNNHWNWKWDLMIAHPPCTYLANSGVQHLYKQEGRWELMKKAREFFIMLLNAPIGKICIENPIPHGYAKLPKYTQIIQPYMFGHMVQKKTCLWLKNLPNLVPTNMVWKGKCYFGKDGRSNGSEWYQLLTSGKDRWKIRSRTFQGVADAMATQWNF